MSKEDFINRWRHELAGEILDACTVQRTGADLGLFVRRVMQKIDARLGQMWQEFQPKPTANGAVLPARKS